MTNYNHGFRSQRRPPLQDEGQPTGVRVLWPAGAGYVGCYYTCGPVPTAIEIAPILRDLEETTPGISLGQLVVALFDPLGAHGG